MLYRWAGLHEEAKRIKPSIRRPGQREEEVEGPAAGFEANGSQAGGSQAGGSQGTETPQEPATPLTNT